MVQVMRRTYALWFAGGALLGLLAAGCQTYDFEPVVPVTLAQTTFQTVAYSQRLTPNMVILVDRSGSMSDSVGNGGASKISELRAAMSGFLADDGGIPVARMGLAFFPGDNRGCTPTSQLTVALPAPTDPDTQPVLQAKADAITNQILGAAGNPGGSTPTASSLAYLGTLPGLLDNTDQRDDFVLLLTDGLPNCNGANPNNVCSCGANACAADALCKCTTGSCHNSGACFTGCLDQDASTKAIAELQKNGIRTIVVGFGADTSGGDAVDTLNAMALAGGFARACPLGTNAECGSSDTCNTTSLLCNKLFYQAANGGELSSELASIAGVVGTRNPCEFILSAQPTNANFLAVFIDGQSVAPGPTTWSYSAGAVTFSESSAVCQRIRAASLSTGVHVEIRIVQTL
jgi:hypothetical protein